MCRLEPLTPRMVRVTLAGPALAGFTVSEPAASVRVLLPQGSLVIPAWNGNEFLLEDGSRPVIRTFTPLQAAGTEVAIEVVRHGPGPASDWAASAQPGDQAAVSGPGRGYAVDPTAPAFLLAGDESALPAIGQLITCLRALDPGVPVQVHVEVATPEGRLALPAHSRATVTWWYLPDGAAPGSALLDAVRGCSLVAGIRVWVAGEAAAVQRIRRHLFDDRGLARAQATVRGYWKHGRSGDPSDEPS